jgi:hypothetical protein
MNAYDLIYVLAILVSGATLIVPYKLISKIAENIDKFGSDNYGKRIIMMKVLSAQSGGVILFYGCYIITTGLIVALLCLIAKEHFIWFLVIGAIVSVFGLGVLYGSLTKSVPPEDLKFELPKSCTECGKRIR